MSNLKFNLSVEVSDSVDLKTLIDSKDGLGIIMDEIKHGIGDALQVDDYDQLDVKLINESEVIETLSLK